MDIAELKAFLKALQVPHKGRPELFFCGIPQGLAPLLLIKQLKFWDPPGRLFDQTLLLVEDAEDLPEARPFLLSQLSNANSPFNLDKSSNSREKLGNDDQLLCEALTLLNGILALLHLLQDPLDLGLHQWLVFIYSVEHLTDVTL